MARGGARPGGGRGFALAAAIVAVALAACATTPAVEEQAAIKPPQARNDPPAVMATCAGPLVTVIVVDAGQEPGLPGPQELGRFGVGSLARIASTLADRSGCFRLLEPDPELHAIPGTVQPELLLRVRVLGLRTPEQSLIDRGIRAARNYVGSYIGAMGSEPEPLQAAEVSLALVCVKQRRLLQRFAGEVEGELRAGSLIGEKLDTPAGANRERVARAYARAQDAAVLYLRAKPTPCE